MSSGPPPPPTPRGEVGLVSRRFWGDPESLEDLGVSEGLGVQLRLRILRPRKEQGQGLGGLSAAETVWSAAEELGASCPPGQEKL